MHNSYPVYVIDENKGFTYAFETKVGEFYFVKFEKSDYYFNQDCEPCKMIYSLSFYPQREETHNEKGNRKIKKDPLVKNTIVEIIDRFIVRFDCPILYICDSSDQKEKCRLRLFHSWLAESNINGDYVHDFRILELQDYTFAVGVIAQHWDININKYLDEIDLGNL